MEQIAHVRQACEHEAQWIVDLSARVQESLTTSGSLQEIGPLSLHAVETSIRGGFAYLLEVNGSRLGMVLVEPLDGRYPNTQRIQYTHWEVDHMPDPLWYLQSLMVDPMNQSKGFGLLVLDGVLRLMRSQGGTIILDCWAGSTKLRQFYEGAGFLLHGEFPENGYKVSVYSRQLGNSL